MADGCAKTFRLAKYGKNCLFVEILRKIYLQRVEMCEKSVRLTGFTRVL